ncbi:MAG TPA: chorismate pyruvate-lyase family protein [Anaerolineales bacterium]
MDSPIFEKPFKTDMDGFDPLKDLFTAQAEKPAQWGEINLRTLSPFQRSLLVIDGTVTKFIEAYTMEPVDVIRISQEQRRLSSEHLWLEAPEGTDVVARQVMLRGEYSHRLYAYAISLIIPGRLGELEKRGLAVDGEGLGRILLNSQLETRREVLWYGREHLVHVPEQIRDLTDGEFISRTYRIIVQGKPVMLINEKFPSGSDRLPSHH